jgi:hypothetical protein
MLKKIKTLSSYAAHARFLNECTSDASGELKVVGEVAQSVVPKTPYAFSLTKTVYEWQGKPIVVLETSHRRYEVFQVEPQMIMPVTPYDAE